MSARDVETLRVVVREELQRAMSAVRDAPVGDAPLQAPAPDAMTVDEAAKLLGVSRDTVYEGAGRGDLPHRRLGKRLIFSRAALTDWLRGTSVTRKR